MSKAFIVSVLLLLIGACLPLVYGQTIHGMVVSGELLPVKYQNKLKLADSFLRKGKKQFAKAGDVQHELDQIEAAEAKGQLMATRLQERRQRMQRKAGTYIEDAHRLQHRILVKALRRQCQSGYRKVEQQVNQYFKEAGVIRRKAEHLSFHYSAVERLNEAADTEIKGLELLLAALQEVNDLETGALSVLSDRKSDINGVLGEEEQIDIIPVLKATTDSVETGALEGKDPEAKKVDAEPQSEVTDIVKDSKEPDSGVFFSIQILASRQSLSQEEIEAGYDGERAVVERIADGWFRYSIGVFLTLEEAKQAMSRENVKGFIVAYFHNRRISIAEALRKK